METEHLNQSEPPREPLAFALVGCGAVARERYLPAFPDAEHCRLAAVVDLDMARAEEAAAAYSDAEGTAVRAATSIDAVTPEIDAAIVAVPHTAHLEVAERLLGAGKHVLIEKPVATTVEECDRLAAATPSGVLLAVSTVRRFFPSSIWMKALLASERLGTVQRARWEEGGAYAWPLATPSVFRRETSGGGVLIDTGPHILDLLLWWFGPETRVVDYADDAMGGVEADASLRLEAGETSIEVELSRLRSLPNRFTIEGSEARAEFATLSSNAGYTIVERGGRVVERGRLELPWPRWEGMFSAQLSEFARAVTNGTGVVTGLDDGRWTVARITEAYALRRPMQRAWLASAASRDGSRTADSELDGHRVAVTGATGFIGGRLVERLLLESSANVEAVVRSYSRLARLSILPQDRLRFHRADLADAGGEVGSALAGCDVVFHCAHGNRGDTNERWQATTEGTRAIARACVAAGVRRLVHFSTVAVYDVDEEETFDETAPYVDQRADDLEYAQAKMAAERALAEYESELEVVVLQPTIVYGPWGVRWTTLALERLPSDAAALPGASEPGGVCNAVYVDDVVSAALLAATVPEARGERFLISGPPTSWGAFYDALRGMVGILSPARPASDRLPTWEQSLYSSRATASTRHAHEMLGFVPGVDLDRGMDLVRRWAEWSRLTSQVATAFVEQREKARLKYRVARRIKRLLARVSR